MTKVEENQRGASPLDFPKGGHEGRPCFLIPNCKFPLRNVKNVADNLFWFPVDFSSGECLFPRRRIA
jgi:hypothetical protein